MGGGGGKLRPVDLGEISGGRGLAISAESSKKSPITELASFQPEDAPLSLLLNIKSCSVWQAQKWARGSSECDEDRTSCSLFIESSEEQPYKKLIICRYWIWVFFILSPILLTQYSCQATAATRPLFISNELNLEES